jgi:hypothetical protein
LASVRKPTAAHAFSRLAGGGAPIEDDLDLSGRRSSRVSRILVISSTLGVAVIAALVFAPILLSNPLSFTKVLLGGDKATSAAPQRAAPVAVPAPTSSAQIETPEPVQAPSTELATGSTANAAVADRASTPPVATASASASDLANTGTSPWPQDPPAWRQDAPPTQTAAVPPNADTPADAPATAIDMRPASVGPASAPAGTAANVPLPRSRPSRLIAARLAIPLPRPRPEIETDTPPDDQAAFDLQVERMR